MAKGNHIKREEKKLRAEEARLKKLDNEKLVKILALLGISAAFGAWGYTATSPYLGSPLFLISWTFLIWLAWTLFDTVRKRTKITLTLFALLVFMVGDSYWIKYQTRPSYVFLVPGAWLNGNTWDLIVNHRGPKRSTNVDILFVDDDRRGYLTRTQSPVSLADINSYQRLLHLSEIDPEGHGSIFAQQLLWKPFAPERSHLTAEMTWSDGRAHEEIEIARVGDKWAYQIFVTDPESNENLLRCRDAIFPSTKPPLRPCFPSVVLPGN